MCECPKTMCRRIWQFAESKSDNVMAYLQKSTALKHWFYPTIITLGQMPTTDLVYTFSCTVSFRAGLFITELWAMWGRFNMIEGYVFSLASIAFCPQRQLVRAYP